MRYLCLLMLTVVAGCATTQKTTQADFSNSIVTNGKIWASLFQQRAAEYDALCIQSFNLARLRLDAALSKPHSRPLAIVTDVDETVLDNSPNAVFQGLQGKEFESKSWNEWTAKATADTMSGALGFFQYATFKNVEIFYVTNRDESEREGTIKNLRKYYFPFADDDHLLLRGDVSSKEPRRESIAKTHDILFLIGDNLSDFSSAFENKTEAERDQQVSSMASLFGDKFIVLPNFSYGSWENAVYNNQRGLTTQQKDSIIRKIVKSQ